MNNQTIKKDPADRSDEAKNELEKQFRSIWLGRQGFHCLAPRECVRAPAKLLNRKQPPAVYDPGSISAHHTKQKS